LGSRASREMGQIALQSGRERERSEHSPRRAKRTPAAASEASPAARERSEHAARERSDHTERERSEHTERERSEPTPRERSEPTPRERSEPQNPPCVSATNLIPDRPVHPEPECLLRKWIDRYVHVAGQQARPGQGILVREKDRSLPKTGLHVHS